ncbi:MAG TPA: two-component regulator propeller domain-containing protein [Flavobacteriales bacterium]|nr:two-component regulator propeller domain-containing protein [Flavobacteriales bacterium]
MWMTLVRRAIRLSFLLLACTTCTQVLAQVDTVVLAFRSLTIQDGLSQGMVSAIIQDRHGFMWFGTKDGLDRYDGYTFKVYRHDPQDSTSLRDNHILSLLEDRAGRLWVGTNKGLDLFDPTTESFHHVLCGDRTDHTVLGCAIEQLLEDPMGTLWVSTERALSRITMSDTTSHANAVVETIIPERVGGMIIDPLGVLRITRRRDGSCERWIIDTHDPAHHGNVIQAAGISVGEDRAKDPSASLCMVMCVDAHSDRTYGVHSAGIIELGHPSDHETFSITGTSWGGPACAEVDASGVIWMSTMSSLYRCDPFTGHSSRVLPLNGEQATKMANVHCIYKDRGGVLWMGTKGHGVLSYDTRVERFHPQRSATVRWMMARKDGRTVMVRGRWAYAYDPVTQRSEPAFSPTTAGFLFDQAGREPSMVQDSSGGIWMNDKHALVRYRAHDGSTERFTPLSVRVDFPLHIQGDSVITFGSDHALGSFDMRTHNFSTHPYPIPAEGGVYLFLQAIHHDPLGVLWLGTMKGLLRFDKCTQEWKHYASVAGDPRSLSTDVIFSLLDDPQDPANYLWVGTNGGGLHRMDKRTGVFKHYGTQEGLPNEVIYGLLADEHGRLWMSTNKGIACLDPATGTVRNFDATDGLQGDEFNRYAFCKQADGTMFFGGVDGFSHFHPRDLKSDPLPVQMSITDIKWMNRSMPFGGSSTFLALPARLSAEVTVPREPGGTLTLEFASMDHGAARKRQYRYQLEGFDPEPVNAGLANTASYTNLDAGEYTFKVWGRNRDGLWNQEPLRLRVVVVPPWYFTMWAKGLYVLLAIGGLIAFDRVRRRALQRKIVRTQALADANAREVTLLKAQLEGRSPSDPAQVK